MRNAISGAVEFPSQKLSSPVFQPANQGLKFQKVELPKKSQEGGHFFVLDSGTFMGI